MLKPIDIEGDFGEGGGQILRTSLALSLVTGKAFRIRRIRAGRPKPGLRKQHLAAVHAAKAVGRARVTGDELNSSDLEFYPSGCFAGDYDFDIGSAGSCTLVLQTILPALMTVEGHSHLQFAGGTHNPFAPPYDFIARAFLPLIGRMGPTVQAELRQWGFFPAGGGRMTVAIAPSAALAPLRLTGRGEWIRGHVRAVVAGLPLHIAERECRAFAAEAGNRFDTVAQVLPGAAGPGNVIMAELESTSITELFTAFGRRGVPAEQVGRELARQVAGYLDAGAPVGPYLADQLLVPLAVAGQGRYRTVAPTRHTHTNAAIIRKFLDVPICLHPVGGDIWEIGIGDS